jgi:general secretion pathway protein C
VVLIAYYLARMIWLFFPSSDDVLWVPPQNMSAGERAAPGTSPENNYGAIVETHLFGNASEDVAAVIQAADEGDDAPDTRLNLSLRATVSATDIEFAHAIIADGSNNEKVYFTRDSVPGGATLHRIDVDRVILNRGGVLEALRLPKEFTGSPVSQRQIESPGQAPESIQQLITENAASFSEIIRPQPFMPNGQLKGYRVFPGRNRQQFIALGLRPGDLVTEINGITLSDPAQGMEMFSNLSSDSQFNVTIERNGQPQVLNLDISQINSAVGDSR